MPPAHRLHAVVLRLQHVDVVVVGPDSDSDSGSDKEDRKQEEKKLCAANNVGVIIYGRASYLLYI